jgi:hypothetical protein
MRIHRQTLRWWLLRLAAGAFVFPATLSGQGRARMDAGRALFEWKGRVDRELRISMRGREAWTQSTFRTVNGRREPVVSRALPREDGTVRVRLEAGRGNADVVQQPSRRNDYTAVIRIQDRSNGSDIYRVTAYWFDRDGNADDGWDGRGNGRDWPNDGGWGRNDRLDRTVLRWSGRVDDGLEIRIQDNRIEYRTLSGKGTRDVHAELSRTAVLRDGAELHVESWTARGDVVVVQQPSARNGYTAVIHIRDPQPSYGFYDFTLTSERGYGARGR